MLECDPLPSVRTTSLKFSCICSHSCSFGLSQSIDPLKSHVSGFHTGTPFYAAPEIALDGKVTRSSDVYSFGVLMTEVYRCGEMGSFG